MHVQQAVMRDPNSHAASYTIAWYPARRKSAWYTPMRFRLIKNGVAHAYDVYTV